MQSSGSPERSAFPLLQRLGFWGRMGASWGPRALRALLLLGVPRTRGCHVAAAFLLLGKLGIRTSSGLKSCFFS